VSVVTRLASMLRADAGTRIRLGIVLALIMEAVTCLFRLGFDRQSTRDTAWLAAWTGGIRIHHGYVGVLLLLVAILPLRRWVRGALIVIGIALVLSDAMHHVLVLWPVTGSPEFDLRYDT